MNEAAAATLRREGITESWLASRLGTQPAVLAARRRGGELLGVRAPDEWEHRYPSWQFDANGVDVLPVVTLAIREARAAGLDDGTLYELLASRSGLLSTDRLVDHLRDGDIDLVLRAIRSAASR